MKRRNGSFKSLWGALILFVTVSVVVTVGILVHGKLQEAGMSAQAITLAMFGIILVLAGICTAIDYVRRKFMVEQPTKRILEATDKIAKGDFSVRLTIQHSYGKYDEYDAIMDNLNKMADQLGKTEVLHNDFISNVSHEIKTPLAVLQSYAQLLQRDVSAEERKQIAEVMISTTKKLTTLVGNVLKLNKLENQSLSLETAPIALADAVGEAVLAHEEAIEQKNIDLVCDFDEVTVVSAREPLDLVWRNLISNAVKFTPQGGRITVRVKSEGATAVVSVTDNGCGISAKDGERIFDKFYQSDTSHAKEGNGLGLALVKKVIDVLGGELSVESEIGKGSTFTVRIRNA